MRSASEIRDKSFFVLGVSHQKANLTERGAFVLTPEKVRSILTDPLAKDKSIFPLSTCNRTEIYAWVEEADELRNLFLKHTGARQELWEKAGWSKKGVAAMKHLFRVAAGLESKILGDFQIAGQVKTAVQGVREHKLIDPNTERLLDAVIKTSKRVKNETKLNKGSASISFAATHYIKNWVRDESNPGILLVGAGDIGKAICGNIPKHIPLARITVVNRSLQRAQALSEKYGVRLSNWSALSHELGRHNIVILATSAEGFLVDDQMLLKGKKQLLLDLSVPQNIDPAVGRMTGKRLLDMDELVAQTQSVLQQRVHEIPKAERIIAEELQTYLDWLENRKFAPVLQEIKSSLSVFHEEEIQQFLKENPHANAKQLISMSNRLVNKITGNFARFLHKHQSFSATQIRTMTNLFTN